MIYPVNRRRFGLANRPISPRPNVVTTPRSIDTYASSRKITEVLDSNAWKRRHVFITGGGFSLADFDFDILKTETTISINRSWEHYNGTIWYGMDAAFIDWMRRGQFDASSRFGPDTYNKWRAMRSLKIFACPAGSFKFEDDVFLVRRLPQVTISRDVNLGIYAGTNAGVGAIMLAVALGATTINLLGIDLKMGESVTGETRTHFHKGYPGTTEKNVMQAMFDTYKKDFEACAGPLKAAGIRIFNLNEQSALRCFEFRSLGEALAERMRTV